MKRFIKLLCVAVCVFLCASILFSAGSVAFGHSHNCIGDGCQYCQAFSLQQELMRLVLTGCFSASFALIFVQLIVSFNSYTDDKKQSINLVDNKVKLTA